MDKNLKKFILYASLWVALLSVIILLFGYSYRYSTINTYNFILLIIMLVTIIVTLAFVLAVITVFFAYRKKYVHTRFSWLVKYSLNILLPFIALISALSKKNKDIIRKFYIDVNNIFVLSGGEKLDPKDILVLLPHCLQDSNCSFKVTADIKNCKRCGKCCLGDISKIEETYGVKVAVVTGGTAARSIVEKRRPKLILSVACERDLTSGISDIRNIPVVGIINDRPHGPCFNTRVDVEVLRQRLQHFLKAPTSNS